MAEVMEAGAEKVAVTQPGQASVLDQLFREDYLSHLAALAAEKANEYQSNTPYPHIYFDNFLPSPVAEKALADFPEPQELDWHQFRDPNQKKKLAFAAAEKLPSTMRDVLFFLNSRPMLEFLEKLTGIESVMPDPHFAGGGLHQIRPGGILEVHVDFSWNKRIRMDRRINVLIYLNKDWKEEYGGHFELWDKDVKQAEKRILPLFNRCAIFSTTSSSYHGHPNPLTCPPDRTRKSMATYYYTNGRPEESEGTTHKHEVGFVQRPGMNRNKAIVGTKSFMRSLVPPILTDIYRSFRSKN